MTALSIRVEVGASDALFSTDEVAEILAFARAHERRPIPSSPILRLATVLRDEVLALPVPDGCTGGWDEFARLIHDGDTCPVHEIGEAPSC